MDAPQALDALAEWALALGLVLVPNVIQTLNYLRIRRTWSSLPVVSARVTYSRLLDCHEPGVLGVGDKRVYEAIIRFRYAFAGQEHESHTPGLRSCQLFPLWTFEKQLASKYRAGDVVDARVSPSDPGSAFLEIAPFCWRSALSTLLGTIGATLALLLSYYLMRASS